jgi:hypothetical protein
MLRAAAAVASGDATRAWPHAASITALAVMSAGTRIHCWTPRIRGRTLVAEKWVGARTFSGRCSARVQPRGGDRATPAASGDHAARTRSAPVRSRCRPLPRLRGRVGEAEHVEPAQLDDERGARRSQPPTRRRYPPRIPTTRRCSRRSRNSSGSSSSQRRDQSMSWSSITSSRRRRTEAPEQRNRDNSGYHEEPKITKAPLVI